MCCCVVTIYLSLSAVQRRGAPAGPPLLLGTEGWRGPLVPAGVDKVILLGQLIGLHRAAGPVLVLHTEGQEGSKRENDLTFMG